MIINLNDRWRFVSDEHQWTVQHREGSRWNGRNYHHTLDHALVWAAQHRVRVTPGDYGPEVLKPIVQRLAALERDIRSALSGFDGRKPGE